MPRKSKKQIEAEKETTPLFNIECTYTTLEDDIEHKFNARKSAGIFEIAAMVESCSDKIIETGYRPYFRDFFLNRYLVMTYTDVEIVEDMETEYELYNNSTLIPEVKRIVSYGNQLELIEKSLDEAIEFKKQKLIAETSSVSDGIIIAFTELLNALKEKVESIDFEKYNDLIPMAQKFKNMDEKSIIRAIVDGNKTEETKADKVVPIK